LSHFYLKFLVKKLKIKCEIKSVQEQRIIGIFRNLKVLYLSKNLSKIVMLLKMKYSYILPSIGTSKILTKHRHVIVKAIEEPRIHDEITQLYN